MAYDEDYDDIMEKKIKKICPICYHTMTILPYARGRYVCLDCGWCQ